MSKSDFRANGRLTGEYKRRRCFQQSMMDINREKQENAKKQRNIDKGPRQVALELYHKEGMLAAWEALEKMNEKLSMPIYTIEILQKWIADENKQNKGQEKNDDGR